MFTIKKATKQQARLRMALIGPSGSGKTYSALEIATRLGQRVIVIDTERGSASKYADLFAFDVLELETFEPRTYVAALRACTDAGADVVVVDSLSHAWIGKGGALEQVDRAAKRQGGNSFGAWRDVTPQHNELVDAMLRTDAHLIVTMRAKTEFVQERDERTGRTVVRKVGLAPVQRDGLEYEFDVVADVNHEHEAVITKSRCAKLSDAIIPRPGEALANTLRAWLSDGVAREPAPSPTQPAKEEPPAREHEPVHQEERGSDVRNEQPKALSEFFASVEQIDLPGEAVAVWMKHRADLAPLPGSDRESAWKVLCSKTEQVGKMKQGAAKNWLNKAIAEETARRQSSGRTQADPGAALPDAGASRAETPRSATELDGVLATLGSAADVSALRNDLVAALEAYPAHGDALWSTATGAALRLGCPEGTLRRMVEEFDGGPQDPPQGPRGGGKPNAPAKGADARGGSVQGRSEGSAARATAGDVVTLRVVSDAAERILEAHGTNRWALRNSLRKHRDELTARDVPELARALAKITPEDPQTRARLTQEGAETIVRGILGIQMRRAS